MLSRLTRRYDTFPKKTTPPFDLHAQPVSALLGVIPGTGLTGLVPFRPESGFVSLRGPGSSGFPHSFVFYQSLVVLASGFDEARLLFDRVTPLGYLLDPFLRVVRLVLP